MYPRPYRRLLATHAGQALVVPVMLICTFPAHTLAHEVSAMMITFLLPSGMTLFFSIFTVSVSLIVPSVAVMVADPTLGKVQLNS